MTTRNPIVFIPGGTPVFQELPTGDSIAGSTPGPTGSVGAQGPSGAQGAQGAQGATGGGGASSPLTTKGDLWGYSTVDARIPVGSDGKALVADSTASLGVSYQTLGAGSGAMVRISQVVCASSQSTVTFSTIPGTFTTLKILVSGRDTKNSVTDIGFSLKINSDGTSGNYSNSEFLDGSASSTGAGGTAPSAAGGIVRVLPGTSGNADAVGMAEITLINYANTSFHKTVRNSGFVLSGGTPTLTVYEVGWVWKSTAAITTLLFTAGGTAFVDGTTFTLYGLP